MNLFDVSGGNKKGFSQPISGCPNSDPEGWSLWHALQSFKIVANASFKWSVCVIAQTNQQLFKSKVGGMVARWYGGELGPFKPRSFPQKLLPRRQPLGSPLTYMLELRAPYALGETMIWAIDPEFPSGRIHKQNLAFTPIYSVHILLFHFN